MTKRKSRFAIDIADDELGSETAPVSPALARRGPMAAAIADNAESLKERRSLEEKIRLENDALAHEHVQLKSQGLVLDLVPLDQIDCEKLIRDRNLDLDLDLDDLVLSIRELGLSNPIRAERKDDGRFELIQGYRRLEAYKRLWRETGEARFANIPVAAVAPDDTLEASYRKMVDENLVRKDISFAEMAELARRYARDPGTPDISADKAVTVLFKAAAYQKRSYIRAFAELLELIGDHIRFPHLIPRNLGLDLRRSLGDEQELAMLINSLRGLPTHTAEEELELLRQFAPPARRQPDTQTSPATSSKTKPSRPQLSFAFAGPVQSGHCTAKEGRLELRADRDFTAIEPETMEKAISAFFDVVNRSRS